MLKILFLFLAGFLYVHRYPSDFGYDEFSVIITYREISDPHFLSFYTSTLESWFKFRFNESVIFLLLYLFIVPIRWTYSFLPYPLLGWLAYVDVSFQFVYIVAVSFNVALLFALYCLFYFRASDFDRFLVLVFIVVYLTAPVSSYWFLTISPYAYLLHGLIFGLYLSRLDLAEQARFPVYLSILGMFSYQFIPAVFFHIFFLFPPFFKRLGRFFKVFFPAIFISFSLLAFIVTRGLVTGLHLDPTSAATSDSLSAALNHKYFFWDILGLDNWFVYCLERFSDSLSFFLLGGVYEISPWLSLMYLVVLCISAEYLRVCSCGRFLLFPGSVILAHLVLFSLNILPLTPSRHWVLFFSSSLFLILSAILGFLHHQIRGKRFEASFFSRLFFCLILFFALIHMSREKQVGIYEEHFKTIREFGANVIFYDGCFNGPLLQYDYFSNFDNYYSCGGRVIKSLDYFPPTFALVSRSEESTVPDGMYFINKFSSNVPYGADFIPVESREFGDGTSIHFYRRK